MPVSDERGDDLVGLVMDHPGVFSQHGHAIRVTRRRGGCYDAICIVRNLRDERKNLQIAGWMEFHWDPSGAENLTIQIPLHAARRAGPGIRNS